MSAYVYVYMPGLNVLGIYSLGVYTVKRRRTKMMRRRMRRRMRRMMRRRRRRMNRRIRRRMRK